MAILKTFFVAVYLAVFCSDFSLQVHASYTPTNVKEITRVLEKYVASDGVTTNKLLGAAAIVVDKNGVLYSGAAGKNDFSPNASPFSLDSFGWIASCTKLITSTAAMQLVQEGRVGLDEDARRMVPELDTLQILRGFDGSGIPVVENNTSPVTLRHLLTHTMGMIYEPGTPDLIRYNAYINRTESAFNFTRKGYLPALIRAPGEGWQYGASLDWAGQLIERVSGKGLDSYMAQRIFKPLRMHSTAFFPEVPRQAAGHEIVISNRMANGSLALMPREAALPPTQEMLSGGAGLTSTARDYGVFLSALLRGTLVGRKTLDEMFSPQLTDAQREHLAKDPNTGGGSMIGIPQGTPISHGLGGVMNLVDIPGKRMAGSMSWGGASNPRWWVDRKSGVACVLFVNHMPWGDQVVIDLWNELERSVYEALEG